MKIKLLSPEISPRQRAVEIVSSMCSMPNLEIGIDDERVLKEIYYLLEGEYKLSNARNIVFYREDIGLDNKSSIVKYSLEEIGCAIKHNIQVFPLDNPLPKV